MLFIDAESEVHDDLSVLPRACRDRQVRKESHLQFTDIYRTDLRVGRVRTLVRDRQRTGQYMCSSERYRIDETCYPLLLYRLTVSRLKVR